MATINKINLNGIDYDIEDATSHKSSFGTAVNIASATDVNPYIFGSDGYVSYGAYNNAGNECTLHLNGRVVAGLSASTGSSIEGVVYVRKGMNCYCSGNDLFAVFHPLG